MCASWPPDRPGLSNPTSEVFLSHHPSSPAPLRSAQRTTSRTPEGHAVRWVLQGEELKGAPPRGFLGTWGPTLRRPGAWSLTDANPVRLNPTVSGKCPPLGNGSACFHVTGLNTSSREPKGYHCYYVRSAYVVTVQTPNSYGEMNRPNKRS